MFYLVKKVQLYKQYTLYYFHRLSATALCNIIHMCSDTQDASDSAWESISSALQRLRREEAAGVPREPQALIEVAQKAATLGKHGIAAVSYY